MECQPLEQVDARATILRREKASFTRDRDDKRITPGQIWFVCARTAGQIRPPRNSRLLSPLSRYCVSKVMPINDFDALHRPGRAYQIGAGWRYARTAALQIVEFVAGALAGLARSSAGFGLTHHRLDSLFGGPTCSSGRH